MLSSASGLLDLSPCPQHGLYQLPTPTPGPQWSNSRAAIAMATTSSQGLSSGVFHKALVQGGDRRASHPQGLGSQENAGEEARPSWFLICFPNKKMEKACRTASKWFSVEAQNGMDRGDHLGRGLGNHRGRLLQPYWRITPIGKP